MHTLHCAMTRSGLETMKSGAPMMGARSEPKSLATVADEVRLRMPTLERAKRPPRGRVAGLNITARCMADETWHFGGYKWRTDPVKHKCYHQPRNRT